MLIHIYIYSYDEIKYKLVNSVISPFQNIYEKSFYYRFKVPNEWFLIRRDLDSTIFIGPTWTGNNKLTTATVFTNFESLENYVHYFNPIECKDIDAHIRIKNTILIKSQTEN